MSIGFVNWGSALLLLSIVVLAATAEAQPKNVVLIIGDGMDDQQITMARNYLHGPGGRLQLDLLPLRSSVQVLTVDEADPEQPLYVAESAGSGTSMAAGIVTSRARISTTARQDAAAPTILELAQAAGMRTGVVTTASITDATPAVFMSHINARSCENPQMMVSDRGDCSQYLAANGGPGSIAEQIAAAKVDVILGGGAEHFDILVPDADYTVAQLARRNGFNLITQADQLSGVGLDQPVLGLFAPSHLPVRLRGEGGRVGEQPSPSLLNLLHWSMGDVSLPEPMACEANPEFQGIPQLADMVQTALDLLSQGAGAARGFLLVVESASIDKKSHARDPCGSIGELQQLEEALTVVLGAAASQPDTLILVTADHSQAAQIVPDTSLFAGFGVPVYTPGSLVRIKMPSGGIMAVNYATNEFFAEEHTGAAVPLFANQSDRALIPAMLNQPDVFQIMRTYLGL